MLRKLLLALILLSLVSPFSHVQAGQRLAPPYYEWAECRFVPPADRVVECGYLTVPENRSDPDNGHTVRLHVAVYRSQSANPRPDPVVYLEGGPGGFALRRVPGRLNIFGPFMAERDFIVFDQRGTGFSEPSLDCPEVTQAETSGLDQSSIVRSVRSSAASAACRARLGREGIDLAAYNTRENASDLADLRLALGYREWNLYGISYGTRLALITMRDHPEGIRSVILDSPYPPQINLNGAEFGPNGRRATNLLFSGCAEDADCSRLFPDLRRVYTDLTRRLNRNPIVVEVRWGGEVYRARIDGGLLNSLMVSGMYSTTLIAEMPAGLYDMRDGDYWLVEFLMAREISQSALLSQGMYITMMCGDRNLPPTLCNVWGVRSATTGRLQAVSSSIPTLVLVGEYDPVTPPRYGESAVRTLSKGFLVEFPGHGHGVTAAGPCPRSIALEFLTDPTTKPDLSCMANLEDDPDFSPRKF